MEVEMLEDDVYFAELSKRISLLITDDDDDDVFAAAAAGGECPAAMPVVPGFSIAHVPQGASMLVPPAYTLYHHAANYSTTNNSGNGGSGNSNNHRVGSWQCGSKGTGVFIPRSSPVLVHSRKKSKSKAAATSGNSSHKAWQTGNSLTSGAPPKRRA